MTKRSRTLKRLFIYTAITGSSLFIAQLAGVQVDDVPKNTASEIRGAMASIDLPSLPVEEDYQGRGKLYDTPIEPGIMKQFLTEGFGIVEIPVRDEPSTGGDQVGFTLRGYAVNGLEWHGDTYPSDSDVGRFEGTDGKLYGAWFKTATVPLFRKTVSREYEPIGVVQNVFIAENYLTLPEGNLED